MTAELSAAPLSLWRNRPFVVFCSARAVSSGGTGMTMVVMPVLMYRLTGSAEATALLSTIETAPYLLFGLFAGALADRVDRSKIMVTANVAAALLLASVPAAAALHRLGAAQLFVVALGVATAYVWFDAANFGALPGFVSRSQVPSASGALWSAGSTAMLLTPTIATSLISLISAPNVLGFDAASYLISGLLLFLIRRSFTKSIPSQAGERRIRSDIAEGINFIRHQPVIRTLTISVFLVCVSWGGSFSLLVVYASRAIHIGHAGPRLGLLYSAGELGGVLASLVVATIAKRRSAGRAAAALMAANAVLLLLLAVAPGYVSALLLLGLYEFAYILALSVGITLRQVLAPDHLRSRVSTTARMIGAAGLPIGALIGGLLTTAVPIRAVFALVAAGAFGAAVLAGWSCLGSGPLASIALPSDSS
jgi:predicted MFS family arabinose efflux permease